IVDWIVAQPWSSGKVGALGISYDGTCAEFLLLNRHPAVRAVAPWFSCFDTYADVAFPGGIHASRFTETWGRINDALDRNAPHEVAGSWVRIFTTGVAPTRDDKHRKLRKAAIESRTENYDVHAAASELVARDDVSAGDPFHNGTSPLGTLAGTPEDP